MPLVGPAEAGRRPTRTVGASTDDLRTDGRRCLFACVEVSCVQCGVIQSVLQWHQGIDKCGGVAWVGWPF